MQLIEPFDTRLPELHKHARLDPLLEAIVRCGLGTEFGLSQGVPLTAGTEHIENGIRTPAIRHPRASPAKAVGVRAYWQQGLQHFPQVVGEAKARRRLVVRPPGMTPLS